MDNQEKIIKLKKYHTITNIILIVVILGVAFYCIKEIEYVKKMKGDYCRMCEDKTGGTCSIEIYRPEDFNVNNDEINVGLDNIKIAENP